MKHNLNPKRLPTKFEQAINIPIQIEFWYDRIDLLFDHPDPAPEILESLRPLCGGHVAINSCCIQYQRIWKSRIMLCQPTKEAIEFLIDSLARKGYGYAINYVEVACDFITNNRADALHLRNFWLRHVVLRYGRQTVVLDKNGTTFYFHRRKTGKVGKSPKVFVIYSDKPTKIDGRWKGKPCSHHEFRISGPAPLESIGIIVLRDLITFDHIDFWRKNIYFVDWHSKQKLGQYIEPNNTNVSGTALRNRANEFIEGYEIDGVFIMHNAILDNREMWDILKIFDSSVILK